MAKGLAHEIVRALESLPRLYHGSLKLNFVWSQAFKCNVGKDIQVGSQLNDISLPSYLCGPSYTINYSKSRVVGFEVSWSPSFVLGRPL